MVGRSALRLWNIAYDIGYDKGYEIAETNKLPCDDDADDNNNDKLRK